MGLGFETALGEITLVVFTTLAPSGAIAYAIMGFVLLSQNMEEVTHKRIQQLLWVPLLLSLVGLVASATRLGSPENALYVFLGVGRSPLSTEVFCAVVFFTLAGLYWLHSFTMRPRPHLERVWLACAIVAGFVFVASVAFAYNARTIVSWATVYVPLNLLLNSLVGGSVLGIVGLCAAKWESVNHLTGKLLVALGAVALVINTVSYCLQAAELPLLQNSFLTAADLVPGYGLMIGAFVMLCAAGIGLNAAALLRGNPLKLSRAIGASVLVLAGIFVMRFAFYMMHLTVGLGL